MFDDDEEDNPRRLSPRYAKHLDMRPPEETNPDKKRAVGGWAVDSTGLDIKAALLVTRDGQRLGALVLRVSGDPHTGRLTFEGMSLFTAIQLEQGL